MFSQKAAIQIFTRVRNEPVLLRFILSFKKQPPEVFYKKGAFKNLVKFTGKHRVSFFKQVPRNKLLKITLLRKSINKVIAKQISYLKSLNTVNEESGQDFTADLSPFLNSAITLQKPPIGFEHQTFNIILAAIISYLKTFHKLRRVDRSKTSEVAKFGQSLFAFVFINIAIYIDVFKTH